MDLLYWDPIITEQAFYQPNEPIAVAAGPFYYIGGSGGILGLFSVTIFGYL